MRRRRFARFETGVRRHLEPGESVCALVQAQTGAAAIELVSPTGLGAGAAGLWAGPHLLFATERHLYVARLGGVRLLDVGEVVLKVPLAEAELRFEPSFADKRIVVGGRTFHAMLGQGKRPEQLVAHVTKSMSSATEAEP